MAIFEFIKKKAAPPEEIRPLRLSEVVTVPAVRPAIGPAKIEEIKPLVPSEMIRPVEAAVKPLVPEEVVKVAPAVRPAKAGKIEEIIEVIPEAAPAPVAPGLAIYPKEGPFFISLARFTDIHNELEAVKRDAAELRNVLAQLQQGSAQDTQILNFTSQRLEDLKGRLEAMSKILRV